MSLLWLLTWGAVTASAAPRPVVLFDFDQGIEGWWGNPWGGGECRVEPAPQPKFGRGALRVVFKNVENGANGVSPALSQNAEWRQGEWPYCSFWLRGPGEPCEVRFAILASGPDGQEISFSRWLTITGDQWRRCLISAASFFQREHMPWQPAKITRVIFGGAGTCYYDVDQFCFQPPTHYVFLSSLAHAGPAPLEPRLEHFPDDAYELCFDPTVFPAEEIHVTATVAWPGEKAVRFGGYMKGAGASEEARVRLPGSPAQPGEARIELQVQERQGQVMYRGLFAAQIVFPEGPARASQWQLIPDPKRLIFHARYCDMSEVHSLPTVSPDASVGIDDNRLDAREVRSGDVDRRALEESQVPDRPEAYALELAPSFLLCRGRGYRGLRWAGATIGQLRVTEPLISGKMRLPCVSVHDWPAVPVRGLTLSLPNSRWGYPNDPPVDPEFFADFLHEFVAGLKFNFVALMLDQGMKLESHAEVAGPAAWSKEAVLGVVEEMRSEGVEVAPLLNSLGHANWVTASHPELREDGDLETLCTSHPNMRQVIGDIYDEVIRLLRPRYFHIGMDECRWQTFRVREEKRCKLCAGKEKAEVFAEQVRWLRDFLAARGVKTMMWGDMLLPAHNGGPPFNVSEAVSQIPKDVVICDWSTSVDPLSLAFFRANGFSRIIKSNSLGCSAADAPLVWGNMWGVWSKLPWLVETAEGYNRYNFLHIMQAAQYSWNLHPDMYHNVGFESAFFESRRLALARHALRRCRDAGEMLGWARACVGGRPSITKDTAVGTEGRAIGKDALGAGEGKWLVLVTALKCTSDDLAGLRERLKDKSTWLGAPVADVVFRYDDGQTEQATLNFGYHLRAADCDGLPYVYAGVALTDTSGWYAVPVENPNPGKTVESVVLKPRANVGTLHLAGAKLFAE